MTATVPQAAIDMEVPTIDTAAFRTGMRATFDEATQEVMAGGKVFQY